MRLPLFLVGLSLSLATEPPKPPSQYPALFEKAAKDAAQAFLTGQMLPEVPKPQTPEDEKEYGAQYQNLHNLVSQAGFLQAGRVAPVPDTPEDLQLYHDMITHMAGKLKVDAKACLERYGALLRPSTTGSDVAQTALEAGLIGELMASPRVPPTRQKELSTRMERTRSRLMAGLLNEAGVADSAIANRQTWGNAADIHNIPPRTRPLVFRPSQVPDLNASGSNFLAFMDTKRATDLANAVASKARGFTGNCYAFVKKGLRKILPSSWYSWLYDDQGSAYKFTENLREDPSYFDKLKLRKLKLSDIPNGVPPVGAIIVYGRGVCGFHPKHGHIEVRVGGTPARYCSDGCTDSRRDVCIKNNLGVQDRVNVYVPVKDSKDS